MRTLVHLAILTAVAGMAPAPLAAHDNDFNISTRTDGPVRSCSDLQMTWDGQPAATSADTLTATGSDLSVHAPRNGGVYVLGSPGRSDFSISACKAVARPIGRDATAALEKIRPAITGKSVTASGPDSGDWVVYFIVNAPANGNVEVETTNGPVHVERITWLDDGAGRQRSDPASRRQRARDRESDQRARRVRRARGHRRAAHRERSHQGQALG